MYDQLSQSEKKWNKENDLEKWQSFYYEDNYNGNRLRARERKLLEFFDKLDLPKGSNVLELGYGAGITSAKIYSRGYNIIGVDVSNKLKKLAVKNCEILKSEGGVKFSFEIGNAEKLEYEDGSFDCVIGLGFLQYLKNPSSCISEIKRVLKSKGVLIIGQRNMYGISSIDGPIKWLRSLIYLITNCRYELRWQNTFLIHPAKFISSLLTPFSNRMKYLSKQLMDHKKIGLVRKNAWSYNRLKKLILNQEFTILSSSGAGYLSKKSILFPYHFKKLDQFLQKWMDYNKLRFLRNFGNSIVFIARKN